MNCMICGAPPALDDPNEDGLCRDCRLAEDAWELRAADDAEELTREKREWEAERKLQERMKRRRKVQVLD